MSIDGRIANLTGTGFLDARLLVPTIVPDATLFIGDAIAYLRRTPMVVADGGSMLIGRQSSVPVTRHFQSCARRLILPVSQHAPAAPRT